MTKPKKCAFCGRFFMPDVRVGSRQKSCKESSCQIKRKKMQQMRWLTSNGAYFKGRYENTKAWRLANPGSQKEWRDKRRNEIQTQISPPAQVQSMRLHLRLLPPFGEIQTQFCLIRQAGSDIWVDGAAMHPREIQTQIGGMSPGMG